MPIERYFEGHGRSVMRSLKAKHGEEKGERVFYATANARHAHPGEEMTENQKRKRALHKQIHGE